MYTCTQGTELSLGLVEEFTHGFLKELQSQWRLNGCIRICQKWEGKIDSSFTRENGDKEQETQPKGTAHSVRMR